MFYCLLFIGNKSYTCTLILFRIYCCHCCCSSFVGGNWKLNGSFESIAQLTDAFNAGEPTPGVEVVIFPTMLALDRTRSLLKNMAVGAQDVSVKTGFGAMTGEISPQLLVEADIRYTLTGHSERRHKVASETSELIAQKTRNAIEAGLRVVLCIGEQLAERDAGTTVTVLKEQMVCCYVYKILESTLCYQVSMYYAPFKVSLPEKKQKSN